MPLAIDHLVVAAQDLDAQAALYRRLGFQMGSRNRHPWGTENHIIQLDGSFLELIGLGEGFAAPSQMDRVYSFAGFVARFLESRQGIAMLVLRSHNAEADRVAFAQAGLGDFARFDFARKGRNPDGGEVEVAFSLAFAQAPRLPDAGFFVCQQHFPQNFWSARLQVHPNGARSINGIVLAQERPQDHAEFVKSFVGAGEAQSVAGGLAVVADGARIDILTPQAIADRYGADALAAAGPPLAVMRIGVRDIQATSALLANGGTPFARRGGAAIVAARDALGAAIVFEG